MESQLTIRQSSLLINVDLISADIYLGTELSGSMSVSNMSTGVYLAKWQMLESQALSENYVARWKAFKGSDRIIDAEVFTVKREGAT